AGGGYPTAGSILYGGTGYVSGTSNANLPNTSLPFTFLLSGALAGNITLLMTAGTYLTQSNQWIFCNNTTGAYTITVAESNSTNTGAAGGRSVILPQGTNNSRSLFLQGDGELNVDLAGVVDARDLLNGVTGSGAVVLATSPTLVTPVLGTPTSGTLTSCTGLPWSSLAAAGAALSIANTSYATTFSQTSAVNWTWSN